MGCDQQPRLQNLEGFAQGTTYHITYWSSQAIDGVAVQQAVDERFVQIDADLSGYRPDSTIEQFNSRLDTDPHEVGREIVALVELARTVHKASQGCYDLTIKPVFDLWGFRNDVFTPPDDAALTLTQERVGMDKLITVDKEQLRKTLPELQVDLASIGQGYSVGRIAAVLEKFGVKNYLVEIGGELQTRGHKPGRKPWRVAVEKPLVGERKVDKVVNVARSEPFAVMTSGTYRHFFDRDGVRYSHILDARNGKPVQHDTVAVTVLNPDPTTADAWSTALLCLGVETGLPLAEEQGIAALFVKQNGDGQQEFTSRHWQELKGVQVE
ncbi:MAG TPA: FAD:protein FMN transferase [Dongiaceae bacterium]|nr:FAD:protein FMN transferase [Dongiaceae bacterium]